MTDAGRYDDGVAGLHLMDWTRRSTKLNLRLATCESYYFVSDGMVMVKRKRIAPKTISPTVLRKYLLEYALRFLIVQVNDCPIQNQWQLVVIGYAVGLGEKDAFDRIGLKHFDPPFAAKRLRRV